MKVFFKIKLLLLFFSNLLFLFSQQNKNSTIFEIALKNNTSQFLSESYFKKAQYFFLEKKWDSTLVYSMKQLSISSKNTAINDYCHFFRGFSFREKKLLKESQKELAKVSRDFKFYNRIKMLLGQITLELENYSDAIKYFKDIEDLPEDNLFDIKKSIVKHNLGVCYLHLEQFDKSEFYLLESVKLLEMQKDSLALVGSYMDMGTLYYQQYKDHLAIPYFEKAYQLSKKIKKYELKRNAVMNMSVVEENRKNYQKALVYRKEFEQWKDSLNDQNKVWAVAELEKQFVVKQKQKEVSLLHAENKIKIAERNGLFYSAIVLLLLLGTSFYFYREKIKTNKTILAQKKTLDELNATKDKLFSIVSHDLRSSVNALKISNAKLQESLENKNFTELDTQLHNNSAIANSTYNLLDNLLNWALLQTKQLYFQQESQHLYSIVQQVEYNYKPLLLDKNIYFENTISKDIFVFVDLDSIKIILRNLLDNAIKFSETNDNISIYTRESQDDFCNLVIEDSGLGMDSQMQYELLKETTLLSKKENDEIIGSNLGIQLCKSMVKKNGGKIAIESQKNKGTKFIVSLLKTEKHESY
jgi:signal transduction histidine kinase